MIGIVLGSALASAEANDLGGQQAYRLSDPNARSVKLSTLDLRERKKAGGYVFNTTNNIERQINCNLSVSATGNAASPTHSGSGIAPVGMQGSGLNATTTGNHSVADNSASGVNSSVSGSNTYPALNANNNVGSSLQLDGNSQLNSGSHAANGTNVNQVGQSNTGSTLTSGISNSPTTVSLGSISADGAQILNTVDTTQSMNDSQVHANVEDSRACDFVETSP
ncbi:hypothetical protein [Solimonas sp. SE-A11]|uniref:hypothetical protein n=1 Tax=Solimonas sp. SE-A11 TaxID=3054954 RepID=UPI00259CFACD|nr:hypothetical protein [Solimonas sp. SE-A11]MDM4772611.1 hypothetical protein [Solimonas sp. SE-A11]